ncbi:toll/interleukin-1 receptor domain-containing protein [Ulvibacterium sp.]|uniref:toll/interleukin-1 receptor domain-containing protein n=1 Tax=Ulvibacterium sp. TaxID=2665914 RepID=UPI003BAD696B
MSKKKHPYIFISYKREEVDIARQLKKAIENEGFNVWWDEDIQCGQVWSSVLENAVNNADCMVIIWSSRSIKSRWVMHEASSAITKSIYTPVRIELIKIEAPYDRHQATDLIDWNHNTDHPGFLDLKRRIVELIPKPISLTQHALNSIWSSKLLLVSLIFALATSYMLYKLYDFSSHQISKLSSITEDLDSFNEQQEGIIDNVNNVLQGTNKSFQLLDGVEADLESANQKILENLSSQRELLSNTDRILNPIKTIDFTLTLEYEFNTEFRVTFDSTLYYQNIADKLKAVWDSIYQKQVNGKFKIDDWEEHKGDTIVFYKDSIYSYKEGNFKFRDGNLTMVTLSPESKLFKEFSMADYLLDMVNQYIVFERTENDQDYYYHLILIDRKKKLPENIVQNRFYLNSSDKMDMWIKFDYSNNKIIKKMHQPFVYQYWQGKKIKSIKDFVNLKVKIRDANDRLAGNGHAGLSGFYYWTPLPSKLVETSIIINNSIILSYGDKEMPTGNDSFTTLGTITSEDLE